MLLFKIEDVIFQKAYSKKFVLKFFGPSNFEIIFVLLTKVIAFHIRVTIIQYKIFGFEKLIQVIFRAYWYLLLSLIDASFYKLFEQHMYKSWL